MTNEMKSLTLNEKTYDSFVDETAREIANEALEKVENAGGGGGASVAVDDTLSESGKAADAGAVGEALYNMNVKYEPGEMNIPLTLGGFYNSEDGGFKPNGGYLSSEKFGTTDFQGYSEESGVYMNRDLSYISFWKDDVYVGSYYKGRYFTGNVYGTAVESLGEYNQAAISFEIKTYNVTEITILGETHPVYYRTPKIDDLRNELKSEISGRTGKKYYLFGDSITYWDSRTSWYDDSVYMIAYPSYIRDVLKANIVNCGVAGNNANQITSRLKGTNLTDAYAITYMAGANDVQQSVSIETYTNNLEDAVEYVCTNYPAVKFYFLAPLYTDRGDIKPYAEAMQSVADKYSVPILRWDKVSQINEFNKGYYTVEGLHPNNIGHKVMADTLIPFLKNN